MEVAAPVSTATYNVLHNLPDEHAGDLSPSGDYSAEEHELMDDDDDDIDHVHLHKHKHVHKETLESFDFNDTETMMWRKVSKYSYSI